MAKQVKKWEGPKPIVCDICNQPVTSKQFVDGKTARKPCVETAEQEKVRYEARQAEYKRKLTSN